MFEVVSLVFISWLIYTLAGLLKSVIESSDFDGAKFTYSFLVTIAVSIIALMTGLEPEIVWSSHGDTISQILVTLMDAGVFLPLIYVFTKFAAILKAAYDRYKTMFEDKKPQT